MRLCLLVVLLVVVAVVTAKPAGKKAGKGGKGGRGGKGGDKDDGKKFGRALLALLKAMGHEPVDPNDMKEAGPKLMAIMAKTKGSLDAAITDTEELTKNPDGTKAEAMFNKLNTDLGSAKKEDEQLLSSASKYMLQAIFNGMKGSKTCNQLASLIWAHHAAKWEAKNGDKVDITEREISQEDGKKLAAAGLADLKCAKAELEKMEAFATAMGKEGAIKSGEEFEHAMGKALTMMARTYRSIYVTMYGMHAAKFTIEAEIEAAAKAQAKAEQAEKRTMKTELDMLLDLLN